MREEEDEFEEIRDEMLSLLYSKGKKERKRTKFAKTCNN